MQVGFEGSCLLARLYPKGSNDMTRLALVFALLAGPLWASEADYDTCIGAGFEDRVAAKFAQRFPSEDRATADPVLVRSVEALVRANCRSEAVADCAADGCLSDLVRRWGMEVGRIQWSLSDRIAALDVGTLPALTQRRLKDPESWVTELPCDDDAATCAAKEASHALTSLERLDNEVADLGQ